MSRSFLLYGVEEELASAKESLARHGRVRKLSSIAEIIDTLTAKGRKKGPAGAVLVLTPSELADALPTLAKVRGDVPMAIHCQDLPEEHPEKLLGLTLTRTRTELNRFVGYALALEICGLPELASEIERMAQEHELTTKQMQLLAMSTTDERRDETAALLGVTVNSLKTRTRVLLARLGYTSSDQLGKALIRKALEFQRSEVDEATLAAMTVEQQVEARIRRFATDVAELMRQTALQEAHAAVTKSSGKSAGKGRKRTVSGIQRTPKSQATKTSAARGRRKTGAA